MKNYRIQNSCQNCVHVFRKIEYDDCDQLFCNINDNRPPKCGSTFMKESFDYMAFDDDPYEEIWDKWADIHNVSKSGVCDNYLDKSK